MKILVDADACPVKDEIIRVARKYKLEVIYFVDINHRLNNDYAQVITVDQGADSVDLALINHMNKDDVIISQDYGVATLAIGKGGYVIHPSGRELNNDNIDMLMFERHLSREQRSQGKRGPKHKKRSRKDDESFYKSLETLVLRIN